MLSPQLLLFTLALSAFATNEQGTKNYCAVRAHDAARLIQELTDGFKLYSEWRGKPVEKWPFDGVMARGNQETPGTYNHFFRRVAVKPLDSLLEERKNSGKPTHVADLFGSALFLSHPETADTLTGVRLVPLRIDRDEREAAEAVKNKRSEIVGDLYRPDTWTKLDGSMRDRGISSFDFLVMRPWGALTQVERAGHQNGVFPEVEAQYCDIIARAYERLSRDGGQMFVQIPGERDTDGAFIQMSERMRTWLGRLKSSGVEVLTDSYGAVRITRTPNSPATLPAFLSN